MRHESGDLGHIRQSSTYEVGNEGHEKIKLSMTDICLVMRDKRLATGDIVESMAMRDIANVGNERHRLAMRDISKIRLGNNRHEHY